MHTAQHLPECKIQRAQAALSRRGFALLRTVTMNITLVGTRTAAGMPSGMHNGALLRDQQQKNAEIMN
mgnify:CR=1 FL=1